MLCLIVIFWLRQSPVPPVVSVDLLGHTNRVGPHTFLAISNRSTSTITLNPQCLVEYAPAQSLVVPLRFESRRVTSIDANVFRVATLGPGEGFVQEFFVFPAGSKSDWKFVYFASRSSTWLEARRFAENWWEKHIRHSKWPPRSRTWHTFNSEWFTCHRRIGDSAILSAKNVENCSGT